MPQESLGDLLRRKLKTPEPQVHPVFGSILATMCPPAPRQPTTPRKPEWSHEWVTDSPLGELVCWFDHYEPEPGYGAPESLCLTNVWLKDVDLAGRIDGYFASKLETEALAALQLDRAESKVEHQIGRAA